MPQKFIDGLRAFLGALAADWSAHGFALLAIIAYFAEHSGVLATLLNGNVAEASYISNVCIIVSGIATYINASSLAAKAQKALK